MIHVTTDTGSEPLSSNGSANGLFQIFDSYGSGPYHAIGSAWIYVISGQVGIGTGGNYDTPWDAFTSSTGQWEFIHASYGISPVNEFTIYAYTGYADFYVDKASVVGPVPEPSTMLLIGSGLIGLWGFGKKFRK